MNIYFLGICFSLAIYVFIGLLVSKRIQSVEDFYVAGRRAPVLLIAGSMIASYTSSGMFMGDAAQCYDGAFSSIILFSGMQSAGYIIGAVFFGRYLRRSKSLTIPEFFEKRFCSNRLRKLAAITAIVTMTVYMLSVVQGIGTLMSTITGVSYNVCLIISMLVVAFISILSGAKGVLITDTLMASVFTVTTMMATIYIANNVGGWYTAIGEIAKSADTTLILSWGGKPGALYDNPWENTVWGLIYGIVWMSVCMIGPWQSSRYLMAKDESTIVRSSYYAAFGVFLMEFLTGIAAVMVNVVNYGMNDSSKVFIWAAMNMMPKLLGVVLLTGILAAGVSSATTFLSLIGASVANDIVGISNKNSVRCGRIVMFVIAIIVLIIAVCNSPSIFWIMFLGGAIVASSWMPVAVAMVLWRNVTKQGAFNGMVCGFLSCFCLKLYSSLNGISLPVYLDPSFVGIVVNSIVLVISSKLTNVTIEEIIAYENLFVIPNEEKNIQKIKMMIQELKASTIIGIFVVVLLLLLWVIPYYIGK